MKKSLFLFFIMILVSAMSLSAGEFQRGRISGRLMLKSGGPMAGGIAAFFNEKSGPPPAPDKYWRVPDEIAEIDGSGNFSTELPEGRYYMWAVKRISGENVGPPREGDYFFISKDEKGEKKIHVITEGTSVDLDIISEGVPFNVLINKQITGLEGAVSDADGKPVEGAIVFAYATPAMIGQPLFMSGITNDSGKYSLRVHEGGTYYLRVRDAYGGGPLQGGPVISGYSATAVEVKTREIKKGIDITVKLPLERGFEGQQTENISGTDVQQEKQEKMEEKTKMPK